MEKILILQTREAGLADFEKKLIIRQTNLPPNKFLSHNFLTARRLPELNGVSHVIMTGSSTNVSDGEQSWFPAGRKVVAWCRRAEIPFLGICFGLHFLAFTGGGKIVKNKNRAELGAVKIATRNTAGTFFDFLPRSFLANEAHSDFVTHLPAGFRSLGSSASCPIQIIAHRTLPLFGLQFHPEHNQNSIKTYLNFYDERYDAETVQKIVSSMVESPPAVKSIIPRFLSL